MSYQAQTAVTLHSKQTNVKRLRLLMFLANGANAEGAIDPAPNQETLAAFIDCSTRTIRTMLNDLEASGELKQTRVGSGPGNPSAYQITLPLATPKAENGGNLDDKGGRKAEEVNDIASTFADLKAEVKAEILEIKAEINQLKAEILEAKGGKVEAERRKCHSFKNADDPYFDPSFDPTRSIDPLPLLDGGGGGHVRTILSKAGIAEPKLTSLTKLPHMTPDYARAHLARAPSVALAIYRMEQGWEMPEPERPKNHIPPELEAIIRR